MAAQKSKVHEVEQVKSGPSDNAIPANGSDSLEEEVSITLDGGSSPEQGAALVGPLDGVVTEAREDLAAEPPIESGSELRKKITDLAVPALIEMTLMTLVSMVDMIRRTARTLGNRRSGCQISRCSSLCPSSCLNVGLRRSWQGPWAPRRLTTPLREQGRPRNCESLWPGPGRTRHHIRRPHSAYSRAGGRDWPGNGLPADRKRWTHLPGGNCKP